MDADDGAGGLPPLHGASPLDNHPGQALDYYTSRGETPLRWGGGGAAALGLEGNVTPETYEAIYGPDGALDPSTGERLVNSKRPGMELVIGAHKSVAELGVIGRAEDMHSIMDAERDATLSYLDDITLRMGGRRGRAATPPPPTASPTPSPATPPPEPATPAPMTTCCWPTWCA